MNKPEFIKIFLYRIRLSDISSYNLRGEGEDIINLEISMKNGLIHMFNVGNFSREELEKYYLELDTIFFAK